MNGVPEPTKTISLRDVLLVIFAKLHVFVGIMATIVVVTLAVTFLTDPVYKVTAKVLVKPVLDQNLKLLAHTQTSMTATPVTMQDINSEVNILNSPQLLREVVRQLHLEKVDPPKGVLSRFTAMLWEGFRALLVKLGLAMESSPEDQAIYNLQKKLEIKPITLSNMVEVSLTGKSPAQITKIVNTLLTNYIEQHVSLYRAKGAKDFFARQAALFAHDVKEAETALERFKKEWSIIEIGVQNEANIELVRTLRENLALVQAQIADRQTKVGVQNSNLAATGDVGAITKDLQSNVLEELVRALGPLLTERERIAVHFQPSSPKYQALDRQVAELRQAYKKQVRALLNGSALDLEGLTKYATMIQKDIVTMERQAQVLSQKQIEYDRLVRNLKQRESNYLLYLNKTEEARIEEQQDTSRVSNVAVTDWAEAPTIPIFPKKVLMLFLAFAIGPLVAVAGAFISYYLDHTVKTPDDIARHCRLPVLSSISLQSPGPLAEATPHAVSSLNRSPGSVPSQRVPLWLADPGQRADLWESWRTLKHNIHFLEESQHLKTILCTGPDRGVGISTTACNLALVLAWDLADQRILVVDANTRQPAVHTAFGLPQEPGLLNFLSSDIPLPDVIQPSLRPNLGVVTLGRLATPAQSPFDLQKFVQFLAQTREDYSFIILDGAPILRASDTLIIATKVDGVMLVVEANQTRYEVINDIHRRLAGNARLLGCVLNKRLFFIPRGLYRYI